MQIQIQAVTGSQMPYTLGKTFKHTNLKLQQFENNEVFSDEFRLTDLLEVQFLIFIKII